MMVPFKHHAKRPRPYLSVLSLISLLSLVFMPYSAFAYGNEDLAALIKPAIVRIVTETNGSVSITPFSFDLERLTITPLVGRPAITLPLPDTVWTSGSGFVVSPRGYILTNAHVVSDYMIKEDLVYPYIKQAFLQEVTRQNRATQEFVMNAPLAVQERFSNDLLNYAMSHARIEGTQTTRVLDPSSRGETGESVTKDAFIARIVGMSSDSYKTGRDVAILKIEAEDLPSIPLTSRHTVSVGEEVLLFGFPGTGDFGSSDLLESTVTAGVVSALKEAPSGDFKLFQIDAKSSQGSSGGPLLDRSGNVVGILTYGTGNADIVGDGFGFAIPAEIGSVLLGDNAIVSEKSQFMTEASRGLSLFEKSRCKEAIESFASAESSTNKKFIPTGYFDEYRTECDRLSAAGLSIDNGFDALKDRLGGIGAISWATFGGMLLLIIVLSVAMVHLFRRLRKGENELDLLEHHLDAEGVTGIPETFKEHGYGESPWSTLAPRLKKSIDAEKKDPATPTVSIEVSPVGGIDSLVKYVRTARASGATDATITKDLGTAGWAPADIQNALT